MKLPDLPRVLNKKEASVTPKVLAWFRKHHHTSAAIEIKSTTGSRIPQSALKAHQRQALMDATTTGIVHKIPDNKTRNPFDAFMLKGVCAWVVACFPKHGVCLVIPANEWRGAVPESKATYRIDL